jgi:hypothetical protein
LEGIKLHVTPVLAANFIQSIGDLAKGTVFHGFHQFLEEVAIGYRDSLQAFQRRATATRIPFLKCLEI